MTEHDASGPGAPDLGSFPERMQYEIEADGVRRLVLDSEQEQALQADNAGQRQAVVQPPPGTVGGPPARAGDAVTETTSAQGGGGPGDPQRMHGEGEHGSGGTARTGSAATTA